MKRIICLDTETTGLDRKNDEILQLSIIDGCGNVLFHNLIKPVNKTSWYEAEKIHGIKPSDVSGCKPLSFYKSEIENILQSADIIVGYNIMGFDFPMLFNNGIENNVKSGSVVFDVMEYYAYINGEFDNYHCTWKYKKLSECAAYYGYSGNSWHDALDDAQATLFCFNAICGNPPVIPERHSGIYFNEDKPESVGSNKKEKERDFKNKRNRSANIFSALWDFPKKIFSCLFSFLEEVLNKPWSLIIPDPPEFENFSFDEYVRDGKKCVAYRVSVPCDVTDNELIKVFNYICSDNYYLHTVYFYSNSDIANGGDAYDVAMLEETAAGSDPVITRK